MNQAAHFVNGATMRMYEHQDIRIVGKVQESGDGKLVITTSDNKLVTVIQTGSRFSFPPGTIVSALGQPQIQGQDYNLRCDMCVKLSDNFDLEAFDKLVPMMTGKFKNLFTVQ
ncbi:Replication factor A protein 3, RFA3 [Carpediemonas membranifera]|uniref:Replication factor A protein 3, RFA3 n=1 Tax=Carpediemonas membranifera TaxID=201153 RepID=A0A8J6B1I1_9EUKA|nr:Replication factor A protein 3, RFA3 [Carpediemonas membranifera]|eukprot:KAG9393678.1 Replication factor A protein 3, RFA3 [Carpediemonas membranifera]